MNKLTFLFVIAVACSADEKPKYKMGTQIMFPWTAWKNDKYEGFSTELADELAKIMHFDYEVYIPQDGQYGLYDKSTDKWNGLIGSVIDGTVDFVITDMIESPKRQKILDFSTPFLHSGVGVVVALGARQAPAFSNFDGLVNHANVPYGALAEGSALKQIYESTDPLIKKAAEYLKAHPENLMSTYQEGIQKVVAEHGKYAFIMDAHWVNNIRKKYPEITLIGDVIIPRNYGIVVKKDSPLLSKFNEALGQLKENKFLDNLVQKYEIGL
jgi:ABC-type amino acid transport substrate-binding protein